MPRLLYLASTSADEQNRHRHITTIQATIVSQFHGITNPELGLEIIALDMDMNGLAGIAFLGIKEEAQAALAKNNGHPS